MKKQIFVLLAAVMLITSPLAMAQNAVKFANGAGASPANSIPDGVIPVLGNRTDPKCPATDVTSQGIVCMLKQLLDYMAHPISGFSTVYDSGITSLPNSSTSITSTTTWVNLLHCNNTDTVARTITITDTAGNQYVSGFSLPANSNVQFINNVLGLKMVGVKWAADVAAKVNCQISGLQ